MNRETLIIVIAAVIIIVILLLLRKKPTPVTPPSPTPTPPGPVPEETTAIKDPSDFVHLENVYLMDDLDLSNQKSLRSFHAEYLAAKSLTFPRIVDDPVSIFLDEVVLDEPIPHMPNRVSGIFCSETQEIDWTTFWPELLASPDLVSLEVRFVYQDSPLIDVGDINIGGEDSLSLRNSDAYISIDELVNIQSFGNVNIPEWYGAGNAYRSVQIVNCDNLISIGDFNAPLVEGRLAIFANYNDSLTSIGNINVTRPGYMGFSQNNLSSVGSILFTDQAAPVTLDFSTNNLSSAVISQMLIDLDNTGFTNGQFYFNNNPGDAYDSLTGPGQTAHDNLIGKSWLVTTV